MRKRKPVLMIHEVESWMLERDLSKYILTFDDGLLSQYENFEKLQTFNTPMYFFISTGIIGPPKEEQSSDVIKCAKAHEIFFNSGDTSYYMNWEQIKYIANQSNCFIGGHSHAHKDLRGLSKIKELHDHLVKDTDKMIAEFSYQNLTIDSFCFPYNYEPPLYMEILKKEGIVNFFGTERLAIEDLR